MLLLIKGNRSRYGCVACLEIILFYLWRNLERESENANLKCTIHIPQICFVLFCFV